MYLAILTLPLLGSIVSGFFGRKIGISGAQFITCTSIVLTTIFALLTFFEVGLHNLSVSIEGFRWIDSESLHVLWGFNFDSLTVSMLIPVLIVSSLVHIYSIGYMSHDPHNQRFFSYLSLFTFMMVILVTANNYLLMFVGWEGVGVCSYLLVCFWFTRIAANQSALSAFLTNRVGDCFLTIGMFAIFWSFGNLDYATVFSLACYMNENIITIIGICILIGAMAKSSQVGLHVWLPMAMEGPTPVSALIHAATMVTAGVYLLMRSSPLIEYSSTVLILCLLLGAITTVFSSLIGLFQQDIKKVIAYSTMSQLGMMVIAVGLSSYNIALFHLVNHAFYKALLFLGAGAVIHAVADNQDFRKYGGLRAFLPLTYSVMLIASLSLVAFPFMTGFYSKDLILESSYGQYTLSGIVVYIIATIGAIFTTLYSVKVLYLTFLTNPNGPLVNYKKAHEGDIFMSLPLMILAVFSIFFGFVTKDMFIGLGSGFFSDNALFIHPSHEILLDTELGVPTLFKLLPLLFTITFSIIAIVLSEFMSTTIIYFKFSRLGYNIFSFFNQRFLIEFFYNKYITGIILKLGGQTTKQLDKGSVEYLGPYGLGKGLTTISGNIAKLNTGVVTSYALYILIGLIIYLLFSSYSYNNIVIIICSIFLYLTTLNYQTPEKDIIILKSYFFPTFLDLLEFLQIASNDFTLEDLGVVSTVKEQMDYSTYVYELGLDFYNHEYPTFVERMDHSTPLDSDSATNLIDRAIYHLKTYGELLRANMNTDNTSVLRILTDQNDTNDCLKAELKKIKSEASAQISEYAYKVGILLMDYFNMEYLKNVVTENITDDEKVRNGVLAAPEMFEWGYRSLIENQVNIIQGHKAFAPKLITLADLEDCPFEVRRVLLKAANLINSDYAKTALKVVDHHKQAIDIRNKMLQTDPDYIFEKYNRIDPISVPKCSKTPLEVYNETRPKLINIPKPPMDPDINLNHPDNEALKKQYEAYLNSDMPMSWYYNKATYRGVWATKEHVIHLIEQYYHNLYSDSESVSGSDSDSTSSSEGSIISGSEAGPSNPKRRKLLPSYTYSGTNYDPILDKNKRTWQDICDWKLFTDNNSGKGKGRQVDLLNDNSTGSTSSNNSNVINSTEVDLNSNLNDVNSTEVNSSRKKRKITAGDRGKITARDRDMSQFIGRNSRNIYRLHTINTGHRPLAPRPLTPRPLTPRPLPDFNLHSFISNINCANQNVVSDVNQNLYNNVNQNVYSDVYTNTNTNFANTDVYNNVNINQYNNVYTNQYNNVYSDVNTNVYSDVNTNVYSNVNANTNFANTDVYNNVNTNQYNNVGSNVNTNTHTDVNSNVNTNIHSNNPFNNNYPFNNNMPR